MAFESGFVTRINTGRLGQSIVEMGGGRKKLGDQIDHSVGLQFLVKVGDRIENGQPVAQIFCNDSKISQTASELVSLSIGTSPVEPAPTPLVLEVCE